MHSFINFMMSVFTYPRLPLAIPLFLFTAALLSLPLLFFVLRWKYSKRKKLDNSSKLKVAFFHPYCNAGGGGEKVLWVAVQALQKRYPDAELYVYTGDVEATPIEILDRVKNNLNVPVNYEVKFVYLHRRRLLEAPMYPYFTLLGQSIGSVCLGFEALDQLIPDIFIDTTGCSFTLPLFKYLGGCKTGCYVHYPTITTDMLRRVSSRVSMYNNHQYIARSPVLTAGKLIYYRIFAGLYSWAGNCSDISMVNSTFTREHLNNLWNHPLHLVYPPCDVDHLKKISRDDFQPQKIRILSLGQFRPEKDHSVQLQALYELREIIPDEQFERITLVLCGGSRNQEDDLRVRDLQDLSKHLSLENNVEFKVNLPYDDLLKEFQSASLGIHTMIDEHFGIAVVEQLAAGLITVAHRSGGPLLDVIETSDSSRLGFLALSPEEYAYTIKYVLSMSKEETEQIINRARASVERFSSENFQKEFLRAVEPLFK